MRKHRADTRIPIFEETPEGVEPNAAVVRYRRKKWPTRDREEGFHVLASDGGNSESAVTRAEFWARVTLRTRYRDAFDVRIVLVRIGS